MPWYLANAAARFSKPEDSMRNLENSSLRAIFSVLEMSSKEDLCELFEFRISSNFFFSSAFFVNKSCSNGKN